MSAPGDGAAKTPRRWLAVLLSLLCPGLGQAYAGFPLRGFAILVALYVGIVPLLLLMTVQATLASLVATLASAVAAYVLCAADAARMAARPRTRFLARGAVFLVCVGFWGASVPLQLAWEWWSHRELPKSYYVPSGAMLPTLLIGDHLFADPRDYDPARGDVVVFQLAREASGRIVPCHEHPDLVCEAFIMRIVGLPGDTVRFDGAALYVNQVLRTDEPGFERATGPQGESWLIRRETLDSHAYTVTDDVHRSARAFADVIVEPDRYFLAGDNRDNSNDSRYWGTLSRADIVGRATKIYWSWDNEESWLRMLDPAVVWSLIRTKTRWDRIGQSIE